ncbi:MAG: hypothetical protein J6B66_06815, partial [Anaerotignum sp.]|nr:hypothetical protein [Anaerotignum sp.]
CEKGIFGSALKHTLSIFVLIFVVSIAAHLLVHYAEDHNIMLADSIWNHPVRFFCGTPTDSYFKRNITYAL